MKAADQLRYLRVEVRELVNVHWWRWLTVWFGSTFLAVATYRIDRALYLRLGRLWRVIRTLLTPVLLVLRPFLRPCEIHYMADIGPGLKILHPGLGVVVSKYAVIGANLHLTGGNCIGGRPTDDRRLEIGDDVSLGANAVVLGPITIGNRVQIGAGAVAVDDAPDDAVLVGVPARPVPRS